MWNPLIMLVAVVAAAVGLSGQVSSPAVTDHQSATKAVCPRMDDVRPVQEDPCRIGHIAVATPPLDLTPLSDDNRSVQQCTLEGPCPGVLIDLPYRHPPIPVSHPIQ
jgi:hypothetical protein